MNDKNSIAHEDAKLAERKKEILEAAKKIFAKHGFRRTQVEMIADELGIGKGTVYRHFGSKKSLFVAVANDCMKCLVDHIEERTNDVNGLADRISAAVAARLEFFDKNPNLVEILLQERTEFREEYKPTYYVYRNAYREYTVESLKDGIEEGIFRNLADVEEIANVLDDLFFGTIMSSFMRGEKQMLKSAGLLAQIILCGLLTPEAQEEVLEKGLSMTGLPDDNRDKAGEGLS